MPDLLGIMILEVGPVVKKRGYWPYPPWYIPRVGRGHIPPCTPWVYPPYPPYPPLHAATAQGVLGGREEALGSREASFPGWEVFCAKKPPGLLRNVTHLRA